MAHKYKSNSEEVKVERVAFLYFDPKGEENKFAQCATCMMFTGGPEEKVATCTIHGKDMEINGPDGTCGLYVHGPPHTDMKGKEMKAITPKESGYEVRQVRCENCKHFDGKNVCMLYRRLNQAYPHKFDLDEQVDPNGCCNANLPHYEENEEKEHNPGNHEY